MSDIPADQMHPLPRLVVTSALALCLMNVVFWLISAWNGQWILDLHGLGVPTDFTNVYAAGRLALEGHAAQAYDWAIHKRVEDVVVGQAFEGYFGWHYPPPYLFVAETLSRLSYRAAFASWVVASAIPYAIVVRCLTGHRVGWLIAAGCPLTLHNVMIGQNGFLTAALIGGALLAMPKRPWLAGLCFGLLIYKPQYGLLIPLALLAGREWRVIAAAAITAGMLIVLSWLVYGTDAWVAFFTWLPHTSQTFLVEGKAQFGKLQSVLGLCRFLGGSEGLASLLQGVVTLCAAGALVALWLGRADRTIKAAGLATAALVATPYIYAYDMVVLAIPAALIVRLGLATGFLRYELAALAAATLLMVSFEFVVAPVGVGATLLIAAVIARRAMADRSVAAHASPLHAVA
jgi:arabinofuranan 3-O-arabinosyltransferase